MNAIHSLRRKRSIPWGRVGAALLVAGALTTAVSLSAAASDHAHSTKHVVISTFRSAKVGTILSDGRTLYTLRPSTTACTSACHKIWIPVLLPKGVTKATAGAGVNAAKLGTKRVTGGLQVTYGGKALFWFFEDTAAGQVNGKVTDKWGKWLDVVLVKPANKPTTTTTKPTNSTTTTNPVTTTTKPTTTTTAPVSGGGGGF
jgi:predicted lipoprotein with Yx(FWY)xxD motif